MLTGGLLAFYLYLPFLGLAVLANLGEENKTLRFVTYAMLVLMDLALLGGGLLAMIVPLLTAGCPLPPANYGGLAVILGLTAVLGALPLIPAARRSLARWLEIEPASCVHTTALAFAIYFVGLTLAQVALIGDLSKLTSVEVRLSVLDMLAATSPLALMALAGVGFLMRRDLGATLKRLGLNWMTARQWGLVIVIILLFLALDYNVLWVWQQLWPDSHALVGNITTNLFGNLASPLAALAVGLSAGIGEELLFRGALQPRFGLVLTSLLFAIGHAHYGLSPAIIEVFFIGLVLGLVRRRTNTTTCLMVHAGYDFLNLLLLPYFPYLLIALL
jgi:membrane protease YdiL (CAAX protease family)